MIKTPLSTTIGGGNNMNVQSTDDLKEGVDNLYYTEDRVLNLVNPLFADKADLIDGLIPSSQLPSYVDDVLEFASLDNFPATGELSKIYVALDVNRIYRWTGSTYVEISSAALADAALKLHTARKINGVDFDGTKDITVPTVDTVSIAKGGTGATTAAQARTNLGLGTAATKNEMTSPIDATADRVLTVGAFGLGGNAEEARFSAAKQTGFWAASVSELNPYPFPAYGSSVRVNRNATAYSEMFLPYNVGDRPYAVGVRSVFDGSDVYQTLYSSGNPIIFDTPFSTSDRLVTVTSTGVMRSSGFTIDSNGFIKSASPIVKLFADKIELNDEAKEQNIEFEKLGIGSYLIKGSTGFAQEGWYIETPKDANGNVLFSVIYTTLENGDISVKTYKKKFDIETASIVADLTQPVDITENRWIDLRLQEIEVTDATE